MNRSRLYTKEYRAALVSTILKREQAAKERQIWIDLHETFLKLYIFRKGVKMSSEYQKAKMLGGLATAQEIDRIDGVLNEIVERLKSIEEAIAYLQSDTAQPKKNED